MRIVPGLRELDDYQGLPGPRAGGGGKTLASFLMMSVGAGFGALALVKDALDRALGVGTAGRALQKLDPSADGPTSRKSVAEAQSEDFSRPTFGRRKRPPAETDAPAALTLFVAEPGYAPSTAPSHAEIGGFEQAPRLNSGPSFQAGQHPGKSI